jgi:hypothetical protein
MGEYIKHDSQDKNLKNSLPELNDLYKEYKDRDTKLELIRESLDSIMTVIEECRTGVEVIERNMN